MKLDPKDVHDRYEYVTKQDFDIAECCEDLLTKRPFGDHNFYIFAHARTDDDGVTKRLIWQPRLTKPLPQSNSMLFKGNPNNGEIRICWILPPHEIWGEYKKDNMVYSDISAWSIYMYQNKYEELCQPERDDLSDAEIDSIYTELCQEAQKNKKAQKIYELD